MRKLYVMLAAVAVMMSSCLNSNNDEYNQIAAIQPGIMLRTVGKVQNDLAMDPANMAIRLGVFLAEAEKQGCADDWSKMTDVSYGTTKYSLKQFLFGKDAVITRPVSGNVYTIKFDDSRAAADSYDSRKGTFAIDTKGVALQAATAANPWSVSIADEGATIKYQSSTLFGTGYMMVVKAMPTMNVYYNNQSLVVSFSNFSSYMTSVNDPSESEAISNWAGLFNIIVANPSTGAAPADFSYSTLYDNKINFTLSGAGNGKVYASFNGKTVTTMRYLVDSITPLVYKPALSFFKIYSGEENVSALADDLSTAYPSNSVKYTWSENSYTISYNGNSYTPSYN